MSDIYTGRGDEGKTDLWASSERVSKASERIEAYGSVDELIAVLGHAAALSEPEIASDIEDVQQHLHIVMAHLADREEKGDKEITAEQVSHLEELIDDYNTAVPWLDSFILPGGSDAGSYLHVARSTARRAERRIVALAEEQGVDEQVLTYINRLSDLLFVMARYQNDVDGADEVQVDYEQ